MKNNEGKVHNTSIRNVKQTRGITLVALVITIVILIILAVVAINAVFGDSGLLQYAQDARNYQANADSADGELINSATEYIDGIIGGSGSGEDETTLPADGSFNSEKGVNTPNLGDNMELVKFDETQQEWIEDETNSEYSYIAGSGTSDNTASHWANARVTKDGIESYFVWIPRYAYRIIYFDSVESKTAYQEGTITEEDAVEQGKIIGYSDSRGIVDGQGRKIESVTSTTKTMVSEDYFMVHPAFTTEIENGGWTEELEGIWIGKYEASSVEGNGENETDDNVTTKTVKVQPGVSSWRYITIGNMYTVSRAYSEELNSHMLKNSEWGAVAYLTESKYGRNGTEIGFNQNTDYLTGGSSYITNVSQSSTGNVYGIYDLRGGAHEYVSAYYTDGTLNNGSSFTDGISDEYSTAYTSINVDTSYKYGDATYETRSWHLDDIHFIELSLPYFDRGGAFGATESNSGVFYYGANEGTANSDRTFRIALIV